MNDLTKFLVDSILNEDTVPGKTALFGGGFKPPTRGHLEVVLQGLKDNPEVDEVYVFVGSGVRNNISQEEAIKIWEMYKPFIPVKSTIVKAGSPLKDMKRFIEDTEDKPYVFIGARPNNEEDEKDVAERSKFFEKYGGIPKRVSTADSNVSGTRARNAAKADNKQELFSYFPDALTDAQKEEIYDMLRSIVKEKKDPKKGTGKKPKGSGRRLYTDEDPNDTVKVKFSTRQDIVDTLNKKSFKAKSHARQSQIINLIHQRVRAAYNRAKDPDVKKRLKTALDYAEQRKEASKKKTQRLKKQKNENTAPNHDGKAAPFGSGYDTVKEGDTIEKYSAKGKKTGKLKQGTVRKRLNIPKDEKIPMYKINKELSRLKKMDKDKDKKGVQLGDKNQKYYKALQLAKTLKSTTHVNENASYSKDINILEKLAQLTQHMIDKGYNIEPLPGLELINGDTENARDFFGKTAYYDPNTQTIVLYTEGRHPKDIARSYAHEMIHHIQNLEGRLGNITTTNTQEDDHLNDIEAEANLKGTMTFRNWTDSLNEVGDATQKPYNWNRTVSKDPDDGLIEGVDYRFTTDLDTNYVAFFQMVGPMEYEFGFNIPGGNQAQVSNKGELFRVMATIVAIMKDFMDLMGNDWSEISFSGSKDPSRREDNRRDKLYMAYIKKNLPSSVNVSVDDDDMTVLSNTLAESLNEIGDASAGVFPYNKNRIDTIVTTLKTKIDIQPDAKWQQHLLPFLKFSSPNADYDVITTAQVNKPLILPDFQADPPTIDLRVDFMVGESDETTNIGEQYKVMATMTQIIKELIAKISKLEGPRLDSVKIFPKSDDGSEEADVDSKRGKLYQAYVEKNLPQGWKASTGKNAWGSYIALYPSLKESGQKIAKKNMDDYKKSNNPSGKVKDPFGLNAYAYELAKGLEESILNEGRYDKFVNQLSRIAFEAIKDGFESGRKILDVTFTVRPPEDEPDIESDMFEFDFQVVADYTEDTYKVDGGANEGVDDDGNEINPLLIVNFGIPKNPKWSTISMDLKDVVRHELEHLTQSGDNVVGVVRDPDNPELNRPGKQMADDSLIRKMIDSDALPKSEYFKLEKEIDAMMQGLYFKAKKSRRPFKDVIDDYLATQPISKEDKEVILNLWRSRNKALNLPVFENKGMASLYTIYLDMDGVIVDFDKQFEEAFGMPPREFEQAFGTQKFWEKIEERGVGFWRGMKWMPGGQELYNRISQFDHYLLSSPSRSDTSKIGKHMWKKDNTPNTKLILSRSYNKKNYADKSNILIDDRESNIQQWRDAGGIGILYKSPEQVNAELDKLGL